MLSLRLLGILFSLTTVSALSLIHAQPAARSSAADAEWEQLSALGVAPDNHSAAQEGLPEWTAVAAAARKFRQEHPDHPNARSATRIELAARIRGEENLSALSAETSDAVAEYLRDTSNKVRDRLELKVQFDLTKIKQAKPVSYETEIIAKAAHARELIRDFSDQPDGYGYMLALARLAPPEQGGALAEEILADSNTPERFKAMARRTAERRALLNQPLRLKGAEAAVAKAAGKTLVIYSWRSTDKAFLAIVKRMASIPGVAFVGINLDDDHKRARTAGQDLPGVQFYEKGGLESPLARQLKLVLNTSVYLVDGQGILRDIDAHRSPYSQLAQYLAALNGGVR